MPKWPLVYIFLAVLIYAQALDSRFLWDDEEQILNNSAIHSLSNLKQMFNNSTFNSGGGERMGGIYFKPFMTTVYTIFWWFFGSNPLPYHIFQLALHIGSACLMVLFLKTFLPFYPAVLAPLIFLVHPFNVECVIYAADLQDALFLFFGLAGLVVLSHTTNFFLISLFLLFSLLSKESGILFLPTTVLYSLLFKRIFLRRILFSCLSVFLIYAFLRFGVADLGIQSGNLNPITRASLNTRLLTLPAILFFYTKGFFFPLEMAIAQHWLVESADWNNFWMPLSINLTLTISSLFLVLKLKDVRLTFFFVWIVLGFGLHGQIFPLDLTVADRWLYFSMIGIIGFLVVLSQKLPNKVSLSIFVTALLLLSTRSYFRAADWRDGFTLFTHDVKLNPIAFDLQNNVGVELFRLKQYSEAKKHFEESTKLAPYWWTNWNNLGVAYEHEGNEGAAEEAYLRSMANNTHYLAYENYAKLLVRNNRLAEARAFVDNKALLYFPNNSYFKQISRHAE